MGGFYWVIAAAFLFHLGACVRHEPVVGRGDGLLQLELGGPHGSLRQALLAVNIAVETPHHLVPSEPEQVAAPDPGNGPVQPLPGEPKVDEPGQPAPPVEVPRGPIDPDYFLATLGPKQTLIHLAQKHLGDGNRYREIMQLNGWDEAATLRLPAGQQVKIPRQPTASSR